MTNETAKETMEEFEKIANGYNLEVMLWRNLPVDNTKIGEVARKSEPLMKQVSSSLIRI